MLLTQWVGYEKRPVAWVSLDRFDDDPIALLVLLAAGFALIAPSARSAAAGHPTVERLAARAGRRLSSPPLCERAATPFVIMLDDLHELRNPECHDVLSVVIAGVPPGPSSSRRAGASSRTSRRRVHSGSRSRSLRRISPSTPRGADRCSPRAESPLTARPPRLVIQRTEGWPVGVFLAAAITRDGGDMAVTRR